MKDRVVKGVQGELDCADDRRIPRVRESLVNNFGLDSATVSSLEPRQQDAGAALAAAWARLAREAVPSTAAARDAAAERVASLARQVALDATVSRQPSRHKAGQRGRVSEASDSETSADSETS